MGKYKTACSICGFALQEEQVQAGVVGTYSEYPKREIGDIKLIFCS
jgi:hypothetical protein